jgi:hypothetical protein
MKTKSEPFKAFKGMTEALGAAMIVNQFAQETTVCEHWENGKVINKRVVNLK